MKTIGIDANEANIANRVGVNVYAYEILNGIYKLQDKWKGRVNFIIYLREEPLSDLPKEVKNIWEYRVITGRKLWIMTKLMPYLLKNPDRIDLLFSPSHYTVPVAFIPRVCSIMDLGYLKYSGQFKKSVFWQLNLWSAISIIVSKRIISISNATRDDIVRHYPFALDKIEVTQLGFDQNKFNNEISDDDVRRIKGKYHIVDDYILYLGTLKPSKNIEKVIQAFAAIRTDFGSLKLVVAGKKGWMFKKIFDISKNLNVESQIIFTDFVPEEDKPALMKGAKLLISPSYWEGFGLHTLESMAVGTLVVVSDRGSFPEIVGDAGVLVNPDSLNSIVEGMKKVLNMREKQYNELVEIGFERARQFSWEKASRKTLSLLENLL